MASTVQYILANCFRDIEPAVKEYRDDVVAATYFLTAHAPLLLLIILYDIIGGNMDVTSTKWSSLVASVNYNLTAIWIALVFIAEILLRTASLKWEISCINVVAMTYMMSTWLGIIKQLVRNRRLSLRVFRQ